MFDGVDINRTVGWFTSMCPVCLQTNNNTNLGTLLTDTKDMLRRIPTKGIGYGALRYLATDEDIRNDLSVS